MHVRTSLLVGVTAATLLAAACSSGDDPTTLPPVTSATSASPSGIPVPEPAREQTEAGAVAFVQHYYDLLNRGYRGEYVDAVVEALSAAAPDCSVCERRASSIEDVWESGGRFENAEWQNLSLTVAPNFEPEAGQVLVVFDTPEVKIISADGSVVTEPAQTRAAALVRVRWTPDGWVVAEIARGDV